MGKEYLTLSGMRRRWKQYPDTRTVVIDMIKAGWKIVPGGKNHMRARCPHGCPPPPKRGIAISSTPQNDGAHADRLRDQMAKCPERHVYMR